MIKKEELTQIVKEVQQDIEKFELLYSKIINRVYFWCYAVAGDETMAKDMTQESILRINTKIKNVQQPEYFSSWMYRLVRNTCNNYLRDNKKHVTEILSNDDFGDGFEAKIKEERRDNLSEQAEERTSKKVYR